MPTPLLILALVCALGCGTVAGVLFAFSNFVMPALGRLPAGGAIAAMQQINIKAINPLFMSVLLGTAVTCVATIVAAVADPGLYSPYLIGAGMLYLVGTIGVTQGVQHPPQRRARTARPQHVRRARSVGPLPRRVVHLQPRPDRRGPARGRTRDRSNPRRVMSASPRGTMPRREIGVYLAKTTQGVRGVAVARMAGMRTGVQRRRRPDGGRGNARGGRSRHRSAPALTVRH